MIFQTQRFSQNPINKTSFRCESKDWDVDAFQSPNKMILIEFSSREQVLLTSVRRMPSDKTI